MTLQAKPKNQINSSQFSPQSDQIVAKQSSRVEMHIRGDSAQINDYYAPNL